MNPHFDHDLVVWNDAYSGRYPAPKYNEQFDLQWSLALADMGWSENPGTSVSEQYIADRVYEWTGVRPGGGGYHDPGMGSRVLDHPVDPALIKGKKCLDLCCGVGRWTRVMQELGAGSVLSTDMSESALKGVSRFNPNIRRVNLMTLREEQPDMVGQFDYVNCWGVVMCTHDPKVAFQNAAATVAPGGSLFLMVYAPEGMHGTKLVSVQRKIFHTAKDVQERLRFVDKVWRRDWDSRYPLKDNLRNLLRRILREDRGYKIAYLDTLSPEFNWVIPLETVMQWMHEAGFEQAVHTNDQEKPACAHHVLGLRKR